MVPSRSRKTAGRGRTSSGRAHLRRGQPSGGGQFNCGGGNTGHAAVVNGTAPKKTRAAMRLILNDGASRRDRSRSLRIAGAKNGHNGQAGSRGHVHGPRIIADKKMAARKQCRQISDLGLGREIDRRTTHVRSYCRRNAGLSSSPEQDDVSVESGAQTIGYLGKSVGRPAFRSAVGRAGGDGNSQSMGTAAGCEQTAFCLFLGIRANLQGNECLASEFLKPTRAP